MGESWLNWARNGFASSSSKDAVTTTYGSIPARPAPSPTSNQAVEIVAQQCDGPGSTPRSLGTRATENTENAEELGFGFRCLRRLRWQTSTTSHFSTTF